MQGTSDVQEFKLVSFSDSDWPSSLHGMKSMSECCFSIGSIVFS